MLYDIIHSEKQFLWVPLDCVSNDISEKWINSEMLYIINFAKTVKAQKQIPTLHTRAIRKVKQIFVQKLQ